MFCVSSDVYKIIFEMVKSIRIVLNCLFKSGLSEMKFKYGSQNHSGEEEKKNETKWIHQGFMLCN